MNAALQGGAAESLQGWLRQAERQLQAHSDSPRLDAELLLAHRLGVTRSALYARGDESLDDPSRDGAERLLQRRLAGEPIAYLRGFREFYSLEITVTPDVLVPRPETELLVDLALEALRGRSQPRVLDLGCGSGAIALAIASQRRDALLIASDCSETALAVARQNAERLQLPLELRQGDWYAALVDDRFDVIVCNPPYVALDDPALDSGVRRYEPALALFAGGDGLLALRRVIAGASQHLHSGALLLIEHGAGQGEAVRKLCERADLQGIRSHADGAGLDRVTCARRAS